MLLILSACESVDTSLDVRRYKIEKIPGLSSAGSGLTYFPVETTSKFTHHFLTVSDGGNEPAILEIKATRDIAQVIRYVPLKIHSKFDLEGITIAEDGSIWLANEEGPALIQFNLKTRKIENLLVAGQKLPTVLRQMQLSRGLESVTSFEDKVYAAMQSSLSIDGATEKALFIRILEYNRSSERIRTFAYPIDEYPDSQRSEIQITDIAALADGRLLVVESAPELGDRLVEIYLKEASDISGILVDGGQLEQIGDPVKIFGKPVSKENQIIEPVKKKLVFDLKEIGWANHAAQGLAILPDFQTVALTSQESDGAQLWLVRLPEPLIKEKSNLIWWLLGGLAVLLFFRIKK